MTRKTAAMPSDPPQRHRWWKLPALLTVILLVLVLGYALAGFFGVPRLVQAVARDELARLGHQLELGELRFNPFSFELSVTGLRLTGDAGAALLGFESLYVNADVLDSIRQRGLVLDAVRWIGPDLALVVEADGSLNLGRLIPPAAEPRPKTSLPHVRVGELSIEKGRIGIEDRSRPQPFRIDLSPIEFSLRDFGTGPGHQNAYAFKGTASTGEELEWTGDFTVQPIGSQGRFALRKLQTSTLVSYLQERLPVRLVSGVAELGGDYRMSLDPSLSLDLHLPAIVIRELALGEPANASARSPASIAELVLHELDLSLTRREVSLRRIGIKGLRTQVQRERDGKLNLTRLYAAPVAPVAPIPAAAAPEPEPTPWRVAVDSIEIGDSRIEVEDRAVEPAVRMVLAGIAGTLTGFSTDPGTRLKLDTHLGIDQKGRLGVQGEIGLQPPSATLALDLQGYDLSVLQPYLTGRTGVRLRSGILAVAGKLAIAQEADAGPAIDFSGEASVSKLDVQDRALKEDLLKWRELRLAGVDFRSTPQSLSIARVDLSEPYARVVISESREINITRALRAPDAATPTDPGNTPARAATETASRPMPIRVKRLRIDQGRMQFTDLSISPQFSAGIFGLNGDVSGLSSDPTARAGIRLEGKVDEFAPVLIDGQLIPAEFSRDTDIALSFRNMDLIRFNPYSGRFAGYNIVKGKLTTDLKYRIHDRELEAEHHVVLDQLEFGEATGSKDAVPLPIKLAVALLKDRHGLIDLGLPVRGNLDDPTFRVGPLVWKVLVNLLTKAVTSPFSALASLIGGGDELAYVDFAPGSAELSETETGKLQQLAGALIERPQLRLDVPLAQADAEDGQVIARRKLDERVPPAAPEVAPERAGKDRLAALAALYGELLGIAPVYPEATEALESDARQTARIGILESALLGKLLPEPSELEILAAARARAVQAAILAHPEIPPERIFLTARRASRLGESGAVRMELSLQ
ncbi:MAG: DUF748 domain-containing protein [Panacagrimonas sp.]